MTDTVFFFRTNCHRATWPLTLSALCFVPPALGAESVLLDRIVAVVNDQVVTRQELDDQMRIAVKQLKRQGTPMPAAEQLEKQMLERLVVQRVLYQTAKESGLKVDDSQLERTIERIAQDNKLTVEQFRQQAEKDGADFSRVREDIRGEILMARLRERDVDAKIVVSEAEIDAFLKVQAAQGDRNDEYNLGHILFLVPEKASPEQLRVKRTAAEKALSELKRGADFRQVSAAVSDAPNPLDGGSLGWRPLTKLPELFAEAVKNLRLGEISPIVRSPNGFHILKLIDKRGDQAPVLVQRSRVRHILVKLSEVVSEVDAKRKLADLKERIEHGVSFAELARLHSEDATASKGGELGWLATGDTVPEFERAMDTLAVDQVSEPVRTQFGFHLIQVLERKTEDMSKERQRSLAAQAIRARKGDDAFEEWIRLLRDKAYVENRLDER
jgi:peptidyl-prolyl cis-trans isomerase SurA